MQFVPVPKTIIPYIHEDEFLAGKTWAVIGITCPGEELPTITETEFCKGVLRLQFHDIDKLAEDKVLFDTHHARQILDFTGKMADVKVDVMLIHCHAGFCRSPAVAAALAKIDGQSDNHFFQQFSPNRRVYRVLLETNESEKRCGRR